MSESESNTESGRCGAQPGGRCGLSRRGRLGVAAAALVGLGALTAVAVSVTAHEGGRHGERDGHGWRHGAPATVEEARDRALDKAAWMLGSVDATPEQEQRVNEIVEQLVDNLYPLREEHRGHRRELFDALSRPQIDQAELERIRTAELALADSASRELMLAVTELSQVLDPEQRQDLVGKLMRFRRHR